MTLRVFLDCEFTSLGVGPQLISIGMVSEMDTRKTFYAELADTYSIEDCSDFVIDIVLPLLEGGSARMTMVELALNLKNWIEGLGQPVTFATDSICYDWPWILEIFEKPGSWPANLDRQPLLLNFNDLQRAERFNDAVELAFASGLRRHHALDDAKANRLGWLANNTWPGLFLDDLRDPPAGDWVIARTAREAIALLAENHFVKMSFDHDLGNDQDGTGYTVALWLEEQAAYGHWQHVPEILTVHSANPAGAARIQAAIDAIGRFREASKQQRATS